MSLSLSCSCGARFEVEETFAGQTISCPECRQPVPAPLGGRSPVRTSGFALASAVFALVLAFTGVGTLLAVLLGIVGLISIRRNRDRLAGTGYALFGIVWGLLFTGLFLFAVVQGEIINAGDLVRERFAGNQVDRSGPLEVRRVGEGYTITRPNERWGVAKSSLAHKEAPDADLLLVQPGQDAYVEVTGEETTSSLDGFRAEQVRRFRNPPPPDNPFARRPKFSSVTVRQDRRLPDTDDIQQAELLVDLKKDEVWFTYLVRLVRPKRGDKVFIIRSWAPRNRYPRVEPELRQALDSFRLLDE